MILQRLLLKHFRNFKKETFQFSPSLTIIFGENAKGKTNLLEAVFFVINGFGFRELKEAEFINYDIDTDLSSVDGVFNAAGSAKKYKIILKKRDEIVEKAFFVNNIRRRHAQYVQDQTKAILFSPEQIEIATGSPEKRRSYFNRCIAVYDLEYKKRLDNYENALRKRNKILEAYANSKDLENELSFWNSYLIEQAQYISKKREEYASFLNNNKKMDHKQFSIIYEKNEFTEHRLKEYREIERKIRKTMIGPQKDDFQMFIKDPLHNNKNVQHFGSRSEQRFTILWLKINEINHHESIKKNKPILLLDDVFSEFDAKNKRLILNLVKKYQTIVTTTEKEILAMKDIDKKTVIEL